MRVRLRSSLGCCSVVKPLHPKPREWDIIAPSKRTAVAAAAAVPDASAQSSTAAVQKSSPPVVTEDAGDADAFPQSEYDREFIDFPNDKGAVNTCTSR